MSTLKRDLSKSRTWPTDAFTVYPRPRNLLTVRALAGDSTMTSLAERPARRRPRARWRALERLGAG
ncbi:MAG: hypothetical protein Q9O62_11625 [Ardenticatenia bacterium]|nr:hypothetical protein [Ardenticatenia bacterium]